MGVSLGKLFSKIYTSKYFPIFYTVVLAFLSFLIFWRVLFFYFFQDDFSLIWGFLYHFSLSSTYFKHPGTPIEFTLLSPIFGTNSFLWQLVGILLKIVTAYCVYIFTTLFINSRKVGILAGVFFSASYIGMSSISSPANHVTLFAAIFILLSCVFLLKALHGEKKFLWKSLLVLISGIFFDPARVAPVLFLLPFLMVISPKNNTKKKIVAFFKKLYFILFLILLPISFIFLTKFANGGPLHDEVTLLLSKPQQGILKLKLLGNFFATILNVFTGLIYGLQPIQPRFITAGYSRLFGIGGMLFFLCSIMFFFYFYKTKLKHYFYLSFFIFWAFLFYFPNFLAEPRAPMSAISHYLYISSIGFVIVIAYGISFLPKKWIIAASLLFLVLNMYKARVLLNKQYTYRSVFVMENIWGKIVSTVPKQPHNIFLFEGQEPWLAESLFSWDGVTYLALAHDSSILDKPYLAHNELDVLNQICSQKMLSSSDILPRSFVSHVFAWKVVAPGVLEDITGATRKELPILARKRRCFVMK